jgi:hypothetical protein
MHIFKIILDICLLRGRAQDLPASMNLVWITAAASVLVNALAMPEQALDLAQLLFIASQAALFGAVVWLVLRLRGFTARWMQTITALYAVDAAFSLLLLPFLPALMEMIQQGPEAKPGWQAYVLLVLSGWLLLIIARVLREATEWPLPIAFMIGFSSLLAVRILGHLLAPLFGLMAQV